MSSDQADNVFPAGPLGFGDRRVADLVLCVPPAGEGEATYQSGFVGFPLVAAPTLASP